MGASVGGLVGLVVGPFEGALEGLTGVNGKYEG